MAVQFIQNDLEVIGAERDVGFQIVDAVMLIVGQPDFPELTETETSYVTCRRSAVR